MFRLSTHLLIYLLINFAALRSAARGDLVVPRTRLQLGNRTFSCGWSGRLESVSHCTFVRHRHYQRSKTCSRHIFSHVPTSLTNYCFAEYEQRTLYGALVVTLAMLLRLINCRFINFYYYRRCGVTGQTLRMQIVYLVRYMLACRSCDSDVFWRMMNTRWHVFQHTHHYSVKVLPGFTCSVGALWVNEWGVEFFCVIYAIWPWSVP